MAKNFIQNGETIDFLTKVAIKSGDVVVLNDLIAIAINDSTSNGEAVGLVNGVWRVKAKQADDIKQGQVLYWSESDGATLTAGSNKRLGIAWTDSNNQRAEVDVKINV